MNEENKNIEQEITEQEISSDNMPEQNEGSKPAAKKKSGANNPVDRLLIDRSGEESSNYTGDEESERD